MLWWQERRKFKEWLLNAKKREIQEIRTRAKKGIECLGCQTTRYVYFFDFGGGFFYCNRCLEKFLNEEDDQQKNGRLSLRFRVLERDGFRCVYCGRNPKDDGVKLEVDHIIPKSKGGQDTLDNLVTACSECNQGKKDFVTDTIVEYARRKL
jgi:hypothetical protein